MLALVTRTQLLAWLAVIFIFASAPATWGSDLGLTIRGQKLPEITSQAEEGFVDLVFGVENVQFDKDGSCTLHAEGQHHGKRVGFKVTIAGGLKPSITPKGGFDGASFRKDGVIISSDGANSDNFIAILAKLYGTKAHPTKMKSRSAFTSIALEQGICDLRTKPVRLKLFCGEDKDYGEVFLNLDLPKRQLALNEKDPEYRPALVKALMNP